jgi:quinol monooxygenase YgiN
MADGGGNPRRERQTPLRKGAAVCVVMRAETLAGADEQAEAMLADLAFRVLAEERGCLSYVVTRVMGSGSHFAVHARFASWQAFQRHAITAHMERALPSLTALLATPVALEIFLEV